MSANTAPQRPAIPVGEVRNVAVSFAGKLDTGETLTGTPTVAEQTTTDLTISNQAVNSAALTINGRTVAIGNAVQFKVLGQLDGVTYTIKITATTTSTPAQTLVGYIEFYGVTG